MPPNEKVRCHSPPLLPLQLISGLALTTVCVPAKRITVTRYPLRHPKIQKTAVTYPLHLRKMTRKYKHIFEPLDLDSTTLKTELLWVPCIPDWKSENKMALKNGKTPLFMRKRARRGVGLIVFGGPLT